MKYYRDIKNVVDTAREEGWEEGLEEGMEEGLEKGMEKGRAEKDYENIKNGIEKGYSDEILADITGLSLEKIQAIRKSFLLNVQ